MERWLPSRKWFVQQATLLAGIAVSAIDTGWDKTETKAAVLWAVAALAAWAVPNSDSDLQRQLADRARPKARRAARD
jgi:hypothetical protein